MPILPASDLHLDATLDCGQTFSFKKNDAGSFSGYLSGVPVRFFHEKGLLHAVCAPGRLTADAVRDYFDLDLDLQPVYRLLESDDLLRPSLAYRGLRLLRQDPWEAAACFIISSNNNIKRIQAALRKLGLGYRAEYLHGTARRVDADLSGFLAIGADPDYARAKERLQEFEGVGPKVADCILLYGFHRLEGFPVDVWIERVMKKLYFRNRKTPHAKILRFARKRWGVHAGYVQQYLFHAVRTGVIKA